VQHACNKKRLKCSCYVLCRFPLIWLGQADPCATRVRLEVGDPVREQLGALLAAWHMALGDRPTTVARAIAAANAIAGDGDLPSVMQEIAPDGSGISPRKLGAFLRKHDRRIEGGLRFEKAGKAHGTLTCWRVAPVG
jgi:putative DNA primase/helicase